ncbi:unnamed protein product, partial [Ectocarpus sp. 12 AP-2014]
PTRPTNENTPSSGGCVRISVVAVASITVKADQCHQIFGLVCILTSVDRAGARDKTTVPAPGHEHSSTLCTHKDPPTGRSRKVGRLLCLFLFQVLLPPIGHQNTKTVAFTNSVTSDQSPKPKSETIHPQLPPPGFYICHPNAKKACPNPTNVNHKEKANANQWRRHEKNSLIPWRSEKYVADVMLFSRRGASPKLSTGHGQKLDGIFDDR